MKKATSNQRKSLSKANSIIFKRSSKTGPKLIDIWDINEAKYKRPSGYIPREEYIKIFEYLQKIQVDNKWPNSAKAPGIAKGTRIPLKRIEQIIEWMRRQSLLDEDHDKDTIYKKGIYKEYYTYYIWDGHYSPQAQVLYDMLKRGARILFRWIEWYDGPWTLPKTPILYKSGDEMTVELKPVKGKKKKVNNMQLMGVIAESLGKAKPGKVMSIQGVKID